MKVINSFMTEIKGSTKDKTYKTYDDKRGIVILSKRPTPSYTRTSAQDSQRSAFLNAVNSWNALSEAEKASYNEQAKPYKLTGFQYYLKEQLGAGAPTGIWYKVTIDNSAGGDLTDFQIKINISGDSQFFTDANNAKESLRLYDSDKSTALNYWIESWDETNHDAIVWVKVPSINASSTQYIYMSLDPTRTEDGEDGEATFMFFDDFIGSSLGSHWVTIGNYNSGFEGGTEYYLTSNEGDKSEDTGIHSATTFPTATTEIYAKIKRRGSSSGDNDTFIGIGENTDFSATNWRTSVDPNVFVWLGDTNTSQNASIRYYHSGSVTSITSTISPIDTTYEIVRARYKSGDLQLDIGSNSATGTGTQAVANYYVALFCNSDNGYGFEIDWIFVKKYATSEPAISYTKE